MSQLYARVFLQILDSSLAEDWQTRHVFEDILKLTSQDGMCDMTVTSIARRTNIPLDIVKYAIHKLESPDPSSRDPDEEGRRLIRIDEHREWGWRVVNWHKYEAIKTRIDQRHSTSQRVARHRAKKQTTVSSPTPPLSNQTQNHTHTHTQHVTPCNAESVTDRYMPLHVNATAVPPCAKAGHPSNSSSRRKPASVEEVIATGSMLGVSEADCRSWHADMELGNWSKVDGTPFGNWPRELSIHRDRLRERASRSNGNGAGGYPATKTKTKGQSYSDSILAEAEACLKKYGA